MMSEETQGVAASPPGSQASPGAAKASPPSVSIPNAAMIAAVGAILDGLAVNDVTCVSFQFTRGEGSHFSAFVHSGNSVRYAIADTLPEAYESALRSEPHIHQPELAA